MELRDLDVVVAGGATGGAAAALLLARAGARVTVIEKVAEPRAIGAGIALAENGLAVLDGLGLAAPLEAAGRPVIGGRIVDARDRTLLAAPDARVLMVRRADLQAGLLAAIEAEPRISLRLGTELAAAHPDGRVELRTPSGVEARCAELVIGADGVHSRVREGGAFGARVRASSIRYVRALVPGEDATNREAWTAAGLFGSFAVPGGTYLFASTGSRATRAAVDARDLDALCAAWAKVYPPAAALLARVAHADELLVNRVIRVRCARFVDGALALLGDAAHAMPPNLGQGANSALVDAAVLVDELRRARDLAAGLAAYDARRRPAVERVADTAARLGRIAEWTNPLARWVRDRVLAPIARRFVDAEQTARVLQEPAATLAAIARAT